jgi:cytochrome c biogenesis protein CcdA
MGDGFMAWVGLCLGGGESTCAFDLFGICLCASSRMDRDIYLARIAYWVGIAIALVVAGRFGSRFGFVPNLLCGLDYEGRLVVV